MRPIFHRPGVGVGGDKTAEKTHDWVTSKHAREDSAAGPNSDAMVALVDEVKRVKSAEGEDGNKERGRLTREDDSSDTLFKNTSKQKSKKKRRMNMCSFLISI